MPAEDAGIVLKFAKYGKSNLRKTVIFAASFDALRTNLPRRTSWYVEEICDEGSRKLTK